MMDEGASVADEGYVTASDVTPIALFHEVASKQLDIQISAFNALDSKAWNALSIGSAILPITFGLLGVSNVDILLLGAIALGLAVVAYAILPWYAWRITTTTSRLRAGEPVSALSNYVDNREFSGEGLQL